MRDGVRSACFMNQGLQSMAQRACQRVPAATRRLQNAARSPYSKQHAHAANPQGVAGMIVDDLAFQFACPYAFPDAETKFRTNGNRLAGSEVTTSRAQFIKLCGNRRSVAQGSFCICDKQKARMDTLLGEGWLSHRAISDYEGRCPVRLHFIDAVGAAWRCLHTDAARGN
jgi:hypothetical protein